MVWEQLQIRKITAYQLERILQWVMLLVGLLDSLIIEIRLSRFEIRVLFRYGRTRMTHNRF